MIDFTVTILGCGSAKPTLRHHTSSQLVNHHGELYMIDCGEGTQQQLLQYNIHPGKLRNIFISHSHGDHCLGLIGMLSSWSLNGRQEEVTLHVPADLEPILRMGIDFFIHHADFEIHIHPIKCDCSSVIFQNDYIEVSALPLDHRVPCCGFLFKERNLKRHLKKESLEQYDIPVKQRESIREGADYMTADGLVIPNEQLTTSPDTPRSYAYLCDTRPVAGLSEILQGVDLIYHDSTYHSGEVEKACEYHHSTSAEAAIFAASCKAGHLLLGHLSSRYEKFENYLLEEAVKIFPNTLLADEGLTVQLLGQNNDGEKMTACIQPAKES